MPKPTKKAASGDGAGTNNKVIALHVLTNPGLILTLHHPEFVRKFFDFVYHSAKLKSQQNPASYVYITLAEENAVFSGKEARK